ncbi:hypothetical protein BJ165DRAFT_683035 [Panaeolus papilionaceus]|nr:hypothetical protein BJ165DRAFT_683035 [Panaeolus papilionaceus]
MDPNLTPIDQELKAGGFGMFGANVGTPGRGSPSIRGQGAHERGGSLSARGGEDVRMGDGSGDVTMGDARGDGADREGGAQKPAGLLSFESAELEGYTSAQLYDLNQVGSSLFYLARRCILISLSMLTSIIDVIALPCLFTFPHIHITATSTHM